MTRVESATGNEGSEADRAAFREVRAMLGQAFFAEKTSYPPSDLFGPLLHAPRVALEVLQLGSALRSLGRTDGDVSLPDDFAEFVAFVVFAQMYDEAVSRGHDFAYRRPMFNHVPRAIASGMRPEAIRALLERDDGSLLPEEIELAEFVRAVLTGGVDDRRWAHAQARLGARRAIDTASYALLVFFVCRLESALGLRDATEAEIEALVKECTRSHRGSGDPSS